VSSDELVSREDVTAIISGIFELGAKVGDVHAELLAIRRLPEDDGEEGAEEDQDG
jgi:hypothetical protein